MNLPGLRKSPAPVQAYAATAEERAGASAEINTQSQALKVALARLLQIVRTDARATPLAPVRAPAPAESAAFFSAPGTASPFPEVTVPEPEVTPALVTTTPETTATRT